MIFIKCKNGIKNGIAKIKEFKKYKNDGSYEDVNEDSRKETNAFEVLEESEVSVSDDEIDNLTEVDGTDSGEK